MCQHCQATGLTPLSSHQLQFPLGMAVLIETTYGDLTIDLYPEEAPLASKNFLKLCTSLIFDDSHSLSSLRSIHIFVIIFMQNCTILLFDLVSIRFLRSEFLPS